LLTGAARAAGHDVDMRRSSFIKLTLLPVLASARLVHADPDPTPPPPPGSGSGSDVGQIYDETGVPPGATQPDPYNGDYDGPPGLAPIYVLPPGESTVRPYYEVPCDVDPNQEKCRTSYVYWSHGPIWRGGFGGYFHGGGG
jgi:hypothetical protein